MKIRLLVVIERNNYQIGCTNLIILFNAVIHGLMFLQKKLQTIGLVMEILYLIGKIVVIKHYLIYYLYVYFLSIMIISYFVYIIYYLLFFFFQQKISTTKNNFSIIEKIEFNKNVDNINYISNDNIVVKTTDNSKYMASHVIFTASLGVLKEKHMTMFTPLLPERKQNAIKACKSLMLMSNIEICLFFGMHLI